MNMISMSTSAVSRRALCLLGAWLALAAPPLAANEPSTGMCRSIDLSSEYGFDAPVTALAAGETLGTFYAGGSFRGLNGSFVGYTATAQPFLDQLIWYVNDTDGIPLDGPVTTMLFTESGLLYAGGEFEMFGSTVLRHIARLDGGIWNPLSSGLQNSRGPVEVHALAEWDDGSGSSLYVAGSFDQAGSVAVDGLARWDGSSWSALPDPVPGQSAAYQSLQVWAQGNSDVLAVGSSSGPVRTWDGTIWRSLGSSASYDRSTRSLGVWNGDLFAGGFFNPAGPSEIRAFVARWNGSRWVDLATGSGLEGRSAEALLGSQVTMLDGLYAGGTFTSIGEAEASYLARWDGSQWNEVLEADTGLGVDGPVYAMLSGFEFRDGVELVVAGDFLSTGDDSAAQVGTWNGSRWRAIAFGPRDRDPEIRTFVEFDSGSGTELYAGGFFSALSGQRVDSVAKWDGRGWKPLQEVPGSPSIFGVNTLEVWDDGSGAGLYAGARSGDSGEVRVARWTGSGWDELPEIGTGIFGQEGRVVALEGWDDGSGPSLFALGSFTFSDFNRAGFAKWDGQTWTVLAEGSPFFPPDGDIEVWDDGTGEALYFALGGGIHRWDGQDLTKLPDFTSSDDFSQLVAYETQEGSFLAAADGDHGDGLVALWDGTSWTGIFNGFGPGRITRALEIWEDDVGSRLYVGGRRLIDSDPSSTLALWDGERWNDVSYSAPPVAGYSVDALYGGEGGTSPFLYIAGTGSTGAVTTTARTCGSPCELDSDRLLCLAGPSRFLLEIEWRDFDGNRGRGRVVPFQTADSGLFYFFDADNWELLVKVLDACSFNDHFWVFSAATTTVEYTLTVTDTIAGTSKTYFNPLGVAAPSTTDTEAFATCDASVPTTSTWSSRSTASILPSTPSQVGVSMARFVAAPGTKMACVASDTTMCLDDGRFALEIDWRDFESNTGQGQVVAGTPSDDSGLFQFFGEENWEVLVKVLDACGFNDRFWVFSAATTNVEYTLRVTDTETGEAVSYFNPLGNAASAVTDTDAFGTCP